MPTLKTFWTDETGATALEYALIAALIFLVASTAILAWGDSMKEHYETLGGKLGGALTN